MVVQAVQTDHGGLLHGEELRGFFSKAGVFLPAGNGHTRVKGSGDDRGRGVSLPAVGRLLLLDKVLHVLLLLPEFHQLQLQHSDHSVQNLSAPPFLQRGGAEDTVVRRSSAEKRSSHVAVDFSKASCLFRSFSTWSTVKPRSLLVT